MAEFSFDHPKRRVSVGVIRRKPDGLPKELLSSGIMALACQNKPPIEIGACVLRIVLSGLPEKRNGLRNLSLMHVDVGQTVFGLGILRVYRQGGLQFPLSFVYLALRQSKDSQLVMRLGKIPVELDSFFEFLALFPSST